MSSKKSGTNDRVYRIAVLLSHPIQYYTPLFRALAARQEIDLTVYFCSDQGAREYTDYEFGIKVKWDIPLLEGYKYKFLKNNSPTPTIFKPLFGLINPGIVKEIIKNRYDANIVHGWNYITHWLSFITSIITRTPILMRAESPLKQELLKDKWKIYVKRLLLGLLFRGVSGFLAIGSENKEFYKFYGVPENKIFLMPYAVENERLIEGYENLTSLKDKIKEEIGIPLDKVIILFSGKLIEKKRPMDLLKAYERVDTDSKALVYLGDGVLRKPLENYVREGNIKDVYFLGFKNQNELPKYYAMADIFVLPSFIGETWGLVVNEAMCFDLPVIVSDMVGCGRDLVKDDENGFVYPVGDIGRLANCLLRLLKEPELRERMGRRSLEIIKKWSFKEDIEGVLSALKFIKSYGVK